ncbi:IS1595 family transposase [Ferruginibacter sp. SUN002]|uniref:IS1595 family transposase n=1 Tax=Ferruginibacter sp. SUN002 TaxID=2937789 RepID=UPI003D365CF4
MFNNLRELILSMPTEQACREYLAKQRWEDGVAICPYCGHGKCYLIEKGERYKCASKECYKRFRITVGTIMEASNIPLVKWFTAIYLVTAHKKGISSYQLGKDLGIAQKNAWFMLHRIREALCSKENIKLDNIVEVDEVYIGGKVGNMSKSKRKKLREEGNTYNTKTMVMGMLERGGNLKLIPVGKSTNTQAICPTVKQNVDTDAVLITDSLSTYTNISKDYAGHEVVNHTEMEYVRDKVIHTNSIEGAFGLLKRSIIGIYHQVTPKHLKRYCDETMFRYNLRGINDAARFNYSLTQVNGRLTWKQLVKKEDTPTFIATRNIRTEEQTQKRVIRPIVQMNEGVIIAEFKSIRECSRQTGIATELIREVLIGIKITTHGYQFKYL